LNDIRFEFAVGKDSAEGIASELVGAGLVDGKDINVITQNLQKLIDSRDMIKVVTFPLVTIQLKTRHCFLLYFNFRIRD
jgi:serine/threonine-protein kinase OSR1/STK39